MNHDEKNTYGVTVYCTNCKNASTIQIKTGVPSTAAIEELCPICKNKSLEL